MSRQGLAQNEQKCQFLAKFGRSWAKILIFTGESKSFGTHLTEKTPRHLARFILLVGLGTKWAKIAKIWPKMTKNTYFGPNLALFGPKILILARAGWIRCRFVDFHISGKIYLVLGKQDVFN